MGLDVAIGEDSIDDFWKGGLNRGGIRVGFDIDTLRGKTGAESAVVLREHLDGLTGDLGLLCPLFEDPELLSETVKAVMRKYPRFDIGLGNPPPEGVPPGTFSYHGRPLLSDDLMRICIAWRLTILLRMAKNNPESRWVFEK